jgi:hypothetical protein
MAYDIAQVVSTYKTLTGLVRGDLQIELDANRIKGTEYADTYQALMNTCLQLSMETPLKDEQSQLYARQREGFDDDLRRKMLDIQMNTWAMMFSSGLLTEKPSIIQNDEVSDLYCYMKEQVLEEPCDPGTP